MEEEKRKAYSEVVEILKLIDDEKMLEAIPFEVVKLIKCNADPTYKPEISKEIPIENQNLKDETYRILAWIASKYWDENIEEIKNDDTCQIDMCEVQKENQNVIENTNEKLSNIDNSSENTEKINIIDANINNEINNLPMIIEENWFEKVKNKIINFFKKVLFKNKKELEEGIN